MGSERNVASILAEWREKRDLGEAPDPEGVIAAHPEHAELLRRRFAAIEQIEKRFGITEPIPRTIGEFEIVREIGRGGMGIVYEAEQPSMRRRVALKVLFPSIVASPRAVERFQREAWAAGGLKHTNIVSVYQLGQDDGIWYSAMELVEGPPLDEVLDGIRKSRKPRRGDSTRGKASESLTGPTTGAQHYFRRVAEIFAGVAEALQVVHDHGVIHRDVKPANLLIDPEGNLKLVDFGLARLEDLAGMTLTGDIVGTPNYMSPEQLTGRSPPDHRTDVYALGATLYEVLTLRPPFQGQNLATLSRRILKQEPRAPRRIDARIPKDLETLALRAMEKEPGRRFESAGGMARELRRFADGASVKSRPIGPLAKAWRTVRRHKVRSGLAAAVFVLAAVGAWALSVAREEGRQRHRMEYTALCREADLAAASEWGAHEEFVEQLEQTAEARRLYSEAIAHDDSRWQAYLGRALLRLGASLEQRLADVDRARERGLPERTAALARAVLHVSGPVRGNLAAADAELAKLGSTVGGVGMDAYLEGRLQQERGQYKQAYLSFTRGLESGVERSSIHFLSLMHRALASERMGEWRRALNDWMAAKQLIGDDSIEIRARSAALWWRIGEKEDAERAFEAVVAELESRGTPHAWHGALQASIWSGPPEWRHRITSRAVKAFPESLLLIFCHIETLFDAGRFEEGLETLEPAQRLYPKHPEVWNWRGRLLGRRERHEDALAAFDEAIRLKNDDPRYLVNRAVTLHNLRRREDALRDVQAALAIAPTLAQALAHKAQLLIAMNKTDEALAAARAAIEAAPGLAWAHTSLGMALLRSGDVDAALKAATHATELNPAGVDGWVLRAKLQYQQGKRTDALASLDGALAAAPDDVDALEKKARLLAELGNGSESAATWKKLIAAMPESRKAPATLFLANLHFQEGRPGEALKGFRALMGMPPDPGIDLGTIHSMIAVCLERLRRMDEALEAHREALRLSGHLAMVHANLGGTLIQMEKHKEACESLQKAIALDPTTAAAHFNLGLGLVRQREFEPARKAFERYVELVPNDPSGHFELARLLTYDLQEAEPALEAAEKLAQVAPRDPRGHSLQGDIHLLRTSPPNEGKALAAYENARAVDPSNAAVHANIGLLLSNRGRFREADAAFRKSMELSKHPTLFIMYSNFLAHCTDTEIRDLPRALDLGQRAARLVPSDGMAHLNLGEVFCARGEWDKAAVSLETAMGLRDGGDGTDWMFMALTEANRGDSKAARSWLAKASAWLDTDPGPNRILERVKTQVESLLEK